jgi:anti-anti-sigma factor
MKIEERKSMFDYQIIAEKEKTIVLFKGDMDIEVTELMEGEIIPAIEKYKYVEINFANVLFVDSTGIGLLLNLVEHLKENDIHITITQITQQVYEVFDLLQIPDILGRELFV